MARRPRRPAPRHEAGRPRRPDAPRVREVLVASQVALPPPCSSPARDCSSRRGAAFAALGLRPDAVLIAEVNARLTTERVFAPALQRLRAVPGVVAAAPSSRTPFANLSSSVEITGLPGESGEMAVVSFMEVGEEYFTALGAPLKAGRAFHSGDALNSPPVAIVDESRPAATSAAAIGQRIHARFRSVNGPPYEIVGIVGNTKEASLREPDRPVVSSPSSKTPTRASNAPSLSAPCARPPPSPRK